MPTSFSAPPAFCNEHSKWDALYSSRRVHILTCSKCSEPECPLFSWKCCLVRLLLFTWCTRCHRPFRQTVFLICVLSYWTMVYCIVCINFCSKSLLSTQIGVRPQRCSRRLSCWDGVHLWCLINDFLELLLLPVFYCFISKPHDLHLYQIFIVSVTPYFPYLDNWRQVKLVMVDIQLSLVKDWAAGMLITL